ncbi:MAG: ABC transporter permease [Chloroflexi bacterium]|nr:MAG: ABC transporter permease [Chloroflexota bacterium]
MTAYVIRRILWLIPVLWAVATITFILMHVVPGGPFDQEKQLPPAVVANLNAKYNLDKPVYQQNGLFFWDLAHGDLGVSFRSQQPVLDLIKDGWKTTAQLGLITFIFALILGMTLGTVSALNHNKLPDYLGVFFAMAGTAMPSFVIGELGNYRKMVLPVLTLGVLPAAYIARITRASMLEVLNQDYIRTARAKGLAEWIVVLRHTIKNAMVPVLTVIGPIFAFLVTGSFITETIFQINGVGRRFVAAVSERDYGLIMGTTLFYAAIIAMANLVVDLLYAAVDPRIRYQ